MKVLACAHHKGGVGKTTVAALVASAAAHSGLRVLGIDLDGQCNFSKKFLKMRYDPHAPENPFFPPVHPAFDPLVDTEWDGLSSSADAYNGRPVEPYPTTIEGLELMPGYGRLLVEAAQERNGQRYERIYLRMHEFLSLPEIPKQYDLVVIDTPPAVDSALTGSALYAATHVVIPCVMEPFSVEGLQGTLGAWMKASAARRPEQIELIGILPNKVKNTALHMEMRRQIEEDVNLRKALMPVALADRTVVAESDHESRRPDTVLTLKEGEKARQEAEAVVSYILSQMGFTFTPIKKPVKTEAAA